jgi:hypothetical protein
MCCNIHRSIKFYSVDIATGLPTGHPRTRNSIPRQWVKVTGKTHASAVLTPVKQLVVTIRYEPGRTYCRYGGANEKKNG